VPEGVKSIRPCYISSYGFEEVSAGMPFWQIGMKNNVAARVWFGFGLGLLFWPGLQGDWRESSKF